MTGHRDPATAYVMAPTTTPNGTHTCHHIQSMHGHTCPQTGYRSPTLVSKIVPHKTLDAIHTCDHIPITHDQWQDIGPQQRPTSWPPPQFRMLSTPVTTSQAYMAKHACRQDATPRHRRRPCPPYKTLNVIHTSDHTPGIHDH